MEAIFQSQGQDWLLTDAVARVVKLYLSYESMATQKIEISTSAGYFTAQIAFYKKRLADVLMDALRNVIGPLLSFRGLNGKYVHPNLSIVLDPKYKSLKPVMLLLHGGNSGMVRKLVQIYDEEVVLPALVSIC